MNEGMLGYVAHCRNQFGDKLRFWTDAEDNEEAFRAKLLELFPASLSVILIRRMSTLEVLRARCQAAP